MGHDLGKVGGGGVSVDGTEEGEEAEGLAASDQKGGVLGAGGVLRGGRRQGGVVDEGVEEHGDALGGEGADDLLEVVDGDLVGVAIG